MKINWKKRIIKDTVDLQDLPQRPIKFTKKSIKIQVYGYDVILPEPPPDEECINFGLTKDEQIWRNVFIPKDLESWSKYDRDKFIDGEFFRRHNGVWIFINGNKLYITGVNYFFLNYWSSSTSPKILFRYTDTEFFWMWFMVTYDPKCYGMLIAKCRQVGETEKAICIIYEFSTRVRNAKCPMQSINEDDIRENAYKRILHAHNEMVFYMRATNRGNTDPKEGLFFIYQRETISKDKMKKNQEEYGIANVLNEDYEYPPLNSSIVYGASKPHIFGTGTFGRYYMDEWGKMEQMNSLYAWNVVKQAMYNRMLGEILGKSILTSTVEDLKGGETLATAKQFWAQSDPEKRNSQGETITGLYRVFRGVLDGAKTDKWGYPMIQYAEEKYKTDISAYMSNGDIKGMIEYKRMNARTIEDVFLNTNEGSQFDIEKLQKRRFWLENNAPKGTYVRGNFKWKDGVENSLVVWEPNSNGRWVVSKHPKDYGLQDNAKVMGVIAPKPANINHFCAGVDPIDQQTTLESEPSLGGICVKAKLNEALDGKNENYYQFTDESRGIRMGDPVDGGANFVSNRVICTYLYRHPDPIDFFNDVVMTMVYYGCDFLPEKDRFGGLHTYIKNKGFELYLMEKPTNVKNYKGQTETEGVSATTGNINTYFEFLTTLSAKWWNTIDHPDLLDQLLSMNWANRGKKDLGVACGWCLYASEQPRAKYSPRKQTEVRHYTENYV